MPSNFVTQNSTFSELKIATKNFHICIATLEDFGFTVKYIFLHNFWLSSDFQWLCCGLFTRSTRKLHDYCTLLEKLSTLCCEFELFSWQFGGFQIRFRSLLISYWRENWEEFSSRENSLRALHHKSLSLSRKTQKCTQRERAATCGCFGIEQQITNVNIKVHLEEDTLTMYFDQINKVV